MRQAFLRVMTYNIHGGRDRRGRSSLAQVGATIGIIQPALAGLQEVEQGFRARSGFADQPGLLAEALGQEVRFAPAIDLLPGSYGGKFGNAILSSWATYDCWAELLPSRGEPRVLLGSSVETPVGPVIFLVCHLGLDQEERRQQVEFIQRRLAGLNGPLILAGDGNARPDAPEFAPLFQDYQEVQAALGMDQPTFPPADARIDYIFCSPAWRVRNVQVVPSPASDHWPLVADLSL